MATDMFGNPLDEEERFRLMMGQQALGLTPTLVPTTTPMLAGPAVDTFVDMPAISPVQQPQFDFTTPTYAPTYSVDATPTFNTDPVTLNQALAGPLSVLNQEAMGNFTGDDVAFGNQGVRPQFDAPTGGVSIPIGSDYTPQQLDTPIFDLEQQNIPSNVVPLFDPTDGLAETDPNLQGFTPFSTASVEPQTSSLTPFAPSGRTIYDKGPDSGWGLTNVSGIYGTEPVVGGDNGVTPGYNPGLDASIINEIMQSQLPFTGIGDYTGDPDPGLETVTPLFDVLTGLTGIKGAIGVGKVLSNLDRLPSNQSLPGMRFSYRDWGYDWPSGSKGRTVPFGNRPMWRGKTKIDPVIPASVLNKPAAQIAVGLTPEVDDVVAAAISSATAAPKGALERKSDDSARAAAAQAEKDRQAQIASANAAARNLAAANARAKTAAAARARQAQAQQAAAQAQAASAAQAQAAQNAARAVLASAAGRDRGGPSSREIAAAIEVLSGVDSFGSGGMRNTRGEVGMDETGYTDTSGYGVG